MTTARYLITGGAGFIGSHIAEALLDCSESDGNTPTLPKHEQMPVHPVSPYAVHKLTGELLCEMFIRIYGLETVALRYFNVFGPRQDPG